MACMACVPRTGRLVRVPRIPHIPRRPLMASTAGMTGMTGRTARTAGTARTAANSREQPRTAAGGFVRFGHAGASRRPQVWVGGLLGARAACAGPVHLGLVAWTLARRPLLLGHPPFVTQAACRSCIRPHGRVLEQPGCALPLAGGAFHLPRQVAHMVRGSFPGLLYAHALLVQFMEATVMTMVCVHCPGDP